MAEIILKDATEYLICIIYKNGNKAYYTAIYDYGTFVLDDGHAIDNDDFISEVRYWEFPLIETGTLFET